MQKRASYVEMEFKGLECGLIGTGKDQVLSIRIPVTYRPGLRDVRTSCREIGLNKAQTQAVINEITSHAAMNYFQACRTDDLAND